MDENQNITSTPSPTPPPASARRYGYCSYRAMHTVFPIFEYLEVLVVCLITILVVYSCGLRICSVSGESMLPTLQDKQTLLVSNLGYEPSYGDIVVFHQINDDYPRYNEPIIKRVIATEGQHVIIDFENGIVTVDNVVLQEDYIQLDGGQYRVKAEHHMVNTIFDAVVPPGCVFVMGDNRNGSLDSRSTVIGFVDERRILGRVFTRITPIELFGKVE